MTRETVNGRIRFATHGLAALLLAFCVTCEAQAAPPELASHLLAGRAALEDGLYGVAESEFEAYLDRARKFDSEPGVTADGHGAAIGLLRALHAQGKFEEMREALARRKRWLKKEGADGTIPYWEALAAYELGDAQGALEELEAYETRFTGEFLPHALRLRAWSYRRLGAHAKALEDFSAYDTRYGSRADAPALGNLLDWAKALEETGDTNQAVRVLERLVSTGGDASAAREGALWLGHAWIASGRIDEAIQLLLGLASAESAPAQLKADAWFSLAEAYMGTTNRSEVVGCLSRGIEITSDEDQGRRARRSLGIFLLEEGRDEEGLALLREFVAAAPEAPLADATQATIANRVLDGGDYEAALVEFQHYLETFTNHAGQVNAYFGKGWALSRLGRHVEAGSAFQKAYEMAELPEQRAEALAKVADALFENGQYIPAVAGYERVIHDFPEAFVVPDCLFQLGESLTRAGEESRGNETFEGLVKNYPEHAAAEEALLRMAELELAAENYRGAVEGFNRLIALYPEGRFISNALLGRGLAHYEMHRFGEALNDLERVTGEFSEHEVAEKASQQIGMCYFWLGMDAESEAANARFLERYPDSNLAGDVMFWTAKTSYNAEQYAKAEEQFLRFAERYPSQELAAEALLWGGRAAAKQSEFRRAVETLTRLVKIYPQSAKVPDARFSQAEALCNLAMFSEAILIYQEIIHKYPDGRLAPYAWIRVGDCQLTLGAEDATRYEEAIRCFRVVTSRWKEPADLPMEAEYKVGRCLEKMGKTGSAIEQYYARIIVRFLEDRAKGVWHNEFSKMWVSRACRDLVSILEARSEWRKAVNVLERVIGTGIPAEKWAAEESKRIRSERWWLFY